MKICLPSILKVIHIHLFQLGSIYCLALPCLTDIYLNLINFDFVFFFSFCVATFFFLPINVVGSCRLLDHGAGPVVPTMVLG